MKKAVALLLCYLFTSSTVTAADYAYFGFEPQIITNYIATKKKLGYVRLTVELMVPEPDDLEIVEHHSPLLRDAIIDIIGKQPEAKIKSIKGRTEIRKMCEERVRGLLKQETGQEIIKRLLFTQWLDD